MLYLDELIAIYGVKTLVELSNDDPNADKTDPSNINTSLINHLLTEMEGRYGNLVRQFPTLKYMVYRLIILTLHLRRQEQGSLLMEENLRREYEILLSQLEGYKYILWITHDGKGKE